MVLLLFIYQFVGSHEIEGMNFLAASRDGPGESGFAASKIGDDRISGTIKIG
jgi:hypothetical protein